MTAQRDEIKSASNTYVYYLLKISDALTKCCAENNVQCSLFYAIMLVKLCGCDDAFVEAIEKMYNKYVSTIVDAFKTDEDKAREQFTFIYSLYIYVMSGCVGQYIKDLSIKMSSVFKYTF